MQEEHTTEIQKFEERSIRTAWDEEREEWYFSVVDVIAVLTDSANPTDYLKKMRKRDELLSSYLGTNCPQVEMVGNTGKKRKVLAATAEQVLRIIQSIPSPKAEPFKLWLAQVGRERIEETIDPEQAIDRALETYLKKGYSVDWVHQRLLSIRVRNELTAEWQISPAGRSPSPTGKVDRAQPGPDEGKQPKSEKQATLNGSVLHSTWPVSLLGYGPSSVTPYGVPPSPWGKASSWRGSFHRGPF